MKTALGTTLRYTEGYTSAAADWSYLPVGTEFRITGINRCFVIDDYGGALVGKKTVDLYFSSKLKMNGWGSRQVKIVITKQGDIEKSRKILAQRSKNRHCRAMLAAINKNQRKTLPHLKKSEPAPSMFTNLERETENSLTESPALIDQIPPAIEELNPVPVFGPELPPEKTMILVAVFTDPKSQDPIPLSPGIPAMVSDPEPLSDFHSIAVKRAWFRRRKEVCRYERDHGYRRSASPIGIERVIDPVC